MSHSKRTLILFALALAAGCAHRPDVVVRPGTQFTKSSSLSLTIQSDPAIFKPELEKEFVRRGFNIITDEVSQVVEKETRVGGGNTVAAATAEVGKVKAAAQGSDTQTTEKQVAKISKSDFVGRIDYLYRQDKHAVSRLNFTIFEVRTGSVVASIGYEKSGDNPEIARAIVEQLDTAMTGIPPEKSSGIFNFK